MNLFNKSFIYLNSFYRFILVLVVATLNFKDVQVVNRENLFMYVALVLYALTFALLSTNKWMSYAEFFVILTLIYFYPIDMLYFLLIIPFINAVSSKINVFDNLLFTMIISAFAYLRYEDMLIVVFVGLGMFIAIGIFQTKFYQIEYLQNVIQKSKKESEKSVDELASRKRELDIVIRMFDQSRRLNETIEVDKLIEQMVDSSKAFFDAEYVCLYVKKNGQFNMVKDSGYTQAHNIPSFLSLKEGVKPIIDASVLRVPIMYDKTEWGVISIYDKKSTMGELKTKVLFPFQEEDFEILSVYIEQVMFKMKHARLLKKMHEMANNDFLTGVPNRRFFLKHFDYLIERAKRGEDLTVLIIDIDHFKKFNDTYGHDVGDEVLKVVAETLTDSVRKMDVVGRLGGEEFAALLPKTNGNELIVAERIRKRIKNIPFVEPITVSIGVSRYGANGDNPHDLMLAADKALYKAKSSGRNCVIEA